MTSTPLLKAVSLVFFFQAEDGIRDLVRSRGLGDVYKRQSSVGDASAAAGPRRRLRRHFRQGAADGIRRDARLSLIHILTLPTSDLV